MNPLQHQLLDEARNDLRRVILPENASLTLRLELSIVLAKLDRLARLTVPVTLGSAKNQLKHVTLPKEAVEALDKAAVLLGSKPPPIRLARVAKSYKLL